MIREPDKTGWPTLIPVLIPYYKAPDKIERCKVALSLQTHPLEIFIRDNSEDNILYTKAMNEGIRKYLNSEFILLLTQDAYLTPNCLQNLHRFMHNNPSCGIASPIQMARGQISWAGSLAAFPVGQHRLLQLKDPAETYWANGACMLLRRSMITEIGLMDESMKFICSDADYSFTARSRGWKVFVVPDAIMEHELDGSAKTDNPWLTNVKINDVLYFTKKWLSGDLYRELSYEGDGLTSKVIKTEYYRLENAKKRLMAEHAGFS